MRVLAALIASLVLPAGAVQWWSVAPAGNSILVTGSPPTGALCEFFVVDTATLKGRGPYRRACDKPPVATHQLTPAIVHSRTSPYDAVTVAGKVVMHYEDASDTRPQWTTYGRSLWLYDVLTSDGPEVLRFDANTGALLQRTAMPQVYRPVGRATVSIWRSTARTAAPSSVLHVPSALEARRRPPRRSCGDVDGARHTVGSSRSPARASRSGASIRLLARPKEIGFVGAYGGGRLWELTCGGKEHLLRVDSETGALTPAGQFPKNLNYCDAPMTVAGGDVVVLDGQKLYVYR